MYKVNYGQATKYTCYLVSTVSATATRSVLQPGKTTNYCLPRPRLQQFGTDFHTALAPELEAKWAGQI